MKSKYLLVILFLFLAGNIFSQCPSSPSLGCDGSGTSLDLYWVGTTANNSGDWSTPCSWRVGSVAGVEPCQAPRSIDNVFFEAASFSVATPIITVNTQARCNDFFINSNVNALAFTPEFDLSAPGFFEIYGDFTLQTNITWTVNGGNINGPEILFKSTTAGHTIQTAGHTMGAIQFDGIGGEWSLQDDLTMGSMNFVFGFLSTSDGANSHDINMVTFDSDVQTGGTSTNRRIDLNNSKVTVSGTGSTAHDRYPYNTTNAPYAGWECRGTTSSELNFNAGASIIEFTNYSVFIRLGGIIYNVIKHLQPGQFYDHFGPSIAIIDTLEVSGNLYFHHEHTFNVLKINSISRTHNFFYNQTINTDLIVSGNSCDPTIFKSEYNRVLSLPALVTADPMNGFTINNLKCIDPSGSHTVFGNGIGTTTGWNVLVPISRDLYWVGGINNNWSEPGNWATDPSGSPLLTAVDCAPMSTDNVFFTASLANGANVIIDQTSSCNNQTWSITAAANFSGGSILKVYGDLILDADIQMACTGNWEFYGITANTILSNGITLPATCIFQLNTEYSLLDDLSFNYIYLYTQDVFNTNGHDLTGVGIIFRSGSQNFSGSTISLSSSVPWNSSGNQGTTVYNTASHVVFTNTSSITLIDGWGPNLIFPNFTLQSPNTTLKIDQYLSLSYSSATNNIVYLGDVTLNGSATFYGEYGSVLVDDNLAKLEIGGDLTLNAGETYEFGVEVPIILSGDLIGNGNCSDNITISGINGASFDINITGTTTLDYCTISDMHSVGAITATNSVDAGNNSNITFPVLATQTYYWRALSGSCASGTCNYDGDWSSMAGYWTNIQANIEGTPGCIPTSTDDIVFDNMSFNGTSTSSVSIPVAVSCHNITAIGANNILTNSGTLNIAGSVTSDGTLNPVTFSGTTNFISSNATGETIDFGGAIIGANINFSNPIGTWTLQNNTLKTNKDLFLNSGILNTNGQILECGKFNSNNSNNRTLNLSNSIFNVNSGGTFVNSTSPSNIYTWNTTNTTNLTFNAGTSIINFTSAAQPTIKSSALDFYYVNFTNVSSAVAPSPVLLTTNWKTQYMKFYGSGRIYGNNFYDTLEFTPNNVYKIESGSIQTLNAPDGVLISSGTAGNEIAIKSTQTGSFATFHKATNGSTSMSSFCFDYLSVEDNFGSSNDPVFRYFVGINSNDISSSGIWEFNRPVFHAPFIEADPDQFVCAGTSTDVVWNLTGSGPYKITYTTNGASLTTVVVPNDSTHYTFSVLPLVDTEYIITAFSGDNCGIDVAGTLIDGNQWVYIPDPSPIANHNDSAACNLNNEANFIHFHENQNGTQRPLVSVFDNAAGAGLGSTVTKIEIDPIVQFINGEPYLQRRFGIEPTVNEAAKVRLYFTQTELNALSTAWGTVLTTGDLDVTKYHNNTMAFTGAMSLHTPTSHGTIPGGITTSSNILYVEIDVPSFSHFVIHPRTGFLLPVDLTNFTATKNINSVDLTWKTESETNNDYFTIERSSNGIDWKKINRTEGAGNSSHPINYLHTDYSPLTNISYYRLKQTDFDGGYNYSEIQKVIFNSTIINIHPNPTNGQITITGDVNELEQIQIFNSNGQIVTNLTSIVSNNNTSIVIDLSNLAKGIYYIKTLTTAKKVTKN